MWKINEYLGQNVETDNVEENLKKAKELLEAEERRNALFNRGLIKTLRIFIKLNEIRDNSMCNMNSYSILLENNRILNGRIHKVGTKLPESLTRVESIIYKKTLYHAIECRRVYLREYVKIFSKIDMSYVRKMLLFQDNVFGELLFIKGKLQDGTPKNEVIEVINQLNSLKSKRVAHIAYDTLEELAHDDPEKKYLKLVYEKNDVVLRSDKVNELFSRYLIEPCQYFRRELGSIFVPYQYDRLILKPEQVYEPKCGQELKFFVSLSRFKFCKLLLDEQDLLLKNVIAVAYNGGL